MYWNFLAYTTVFISDLIPASIFLDVKKAFNSITQKILISKPAHYGVGREAFSWFIFLPHLQIYCCGGCKQVSPVEDRVPSKEFFHQGPFWFHAKH